MFTCKGTRPYGGNFPLILKGFLQRGAADIRNKMRPGMTIVDMMIAEQEQ